MRVLDGKTCANAVISGLQEKLDCSSGRPPCVVFIRVGEDPASVSYVASKQKKAAELGIESRLLTFAEDICEEDLLAVIGQCNRDCAIDAILVQSPLPAQIHEQRIFNAVAVEKDVDGFSANNLGRLVQDDPAAFVACTPAGIVEMLHQTGIETRGKHVVVVGRSLIVGKPAALLFLRKGVFGDATVTVCHSRTRNLAAITRQADILIAAIGKPHFVGAEMVAEGTVVIDVGINRVEDATRPRGYRITGDVDFDAVAAKCSAISPVPGGVGLMTVAMLMANTVKAWENSPRNRNT